MRLLLDTHVLLWALAEPKKLSAAVRARIEDPGTEALFSAASIWEIAIKSQLKRAAFQVRPDEIAEAATASGFTELPVRAEAAAMVARLPLHHRDPFDRLLIAQAMAEPARLCTVDGALAPYANLVSFLQISVASIQDLIALKRPVGRPQDLEDIRAMEARLGGGK